MTLIEELKKRCGTCDHLRDGGCLNAHEVEKFYDDLDLGGITVRETDEGYITPLIDVGWCSRWRT